MIDRFRRFRYRASRTKLLVPLTWLRHRGLDSAADVFLASFPRSGQNWTRFLLAELLTGKPTDFDTLENLIPKVGAHNHAPALLSGEGRLIQTHRRWRSEYKRAIYLIRDARDVLLSDYAWDDSLHLISHFDINNLDEYLVPWLKGHLQTMGSWHQHIASWLDSPIARNGNLLVIKYEDMRKNTEAALYQMLDFLGVSVEKARVADAVRNNSVERMRAKEDASRRYAPAALGRKSGEEHRFVRKGSIGGWRERLTEIQLRVIDEYAGATLARLGYSTGYSPFSHQRAEPVTCNVGRS